MQKKLLVILALIMVVPFLLLTASCQQQTVKDTDNGKEVTEDKETPEERAKRIKEEELKAKFENEDVYFAFDSSSLDAAAQSVLRDKAEYMKARPNATVTIEGHCDERGTNEYNLALGDRRAESAKAFLVDLGIEGARMETVSYGEERPMDPGHDEAAWAKNRRAHFVLR